ncbi:hypothetical protein JTB14_035557 [Gonioctena quinquepunctata]|nr:hypothetical protein JTB14_035557 [Gonioctena quinquepunctata]
METIDQLEIKRDQIKAQLFRYSSFVQTMEDTKIIELQARLEKIEFCFNEFHNIQCEIELLDTEENNSNERERFEDSYSIVAAGRAKVIAHHARIQALSNNQQAQCVKLELDT